MSDYVAVCVRCRRVRGLNGVFALFADEGARCIFCDCGGSAAGLGLFMASCVPPTPAVAICEHRGLLRLDWDFERCCAGHIVDGVEQPSCYSCPDCGRWVSAADYEWLQERRGQE